MIPTEHQEQCALFEWQEWMAKQMPELHLMHAIPNGGKRDIRTAAMLKAGAQRGATGENSVRWEAEHADVLVAPIALVLKDAMMGEVTGDMAACVGASRAKKVFVPTQRCNAYVAGVGSMSMQELIADAARQAVGAADR